MKASQWIDRVRTEQQLPSDYAAAKAMNLSRFTVSGYRQRPDATLDDAIAVRVAHKLGIDPGIVLADQAMERAKDADARGAWASILQRLGGVAAGVLVVIGAGGAPSSAGAAAVKSMTTGPAVYYVNRRCRRSSLQAMADALRSPARMMLAAA
jgi:hypothetical protein